MNLQGLKIQKLFGEFDYEIALNQEYGITILSGPNGYGKTTILNILYNLFNQRFDFFRELKFEFIIIYFSNDETINISKKETRKSEPIVHIVNGQQQILVQNKGIVDIQLELFHNNISKEIFIYNSEAENKLIQGLARFFPVRRVSDGILTNMLTGTNISLKEFLKENIDDLPVKTIGLINMNKNQQNNSSLIHLLLSSINIYIIQEQRLIKQNSLLKINQPMPNNIGFNNSINIYTNDLREKISNKQSEAFQIAQKLDSTFPKRLIDCTEVVPEIQFKERLEKLTQKQKKLQQFGISTSIQEFTDYKEENQRVLSVYLDDAEKKTDVFNDLLDKINIFVKLVNEKHFTSKFLNINSQKGFFFTIDNNKSINLTALSSGEQQELVLLYELLFKTKPNTLILIDEPEISLHVVWQKAFINDLVQIANVQDISFLVATHSPQIINRRWDLTTDLHDLYEKTNSGGENESEQAS